MELVRGVLTRTVEATGYLAGAESQPTSRGCPERGSTLPTRVTGCRRSRSPGMSSTLRRPRWTSRCPVSSRISGAFAGGRRCRAADSSVKTQQPYRREWTSRVLQRLPVLVSACDVNDVIVVKEVPEEAHEHVYSRPGGRPWLAGPFFLRGATDRDHGEVPAYGTVPFAAQGHGDQDRTQLATAGNPADLMLIIRRRGQARQQRVPGHGSNGMNSLSCGTQGCIHSQRFFPGYGLSRYGDTKLANGAGQDIAFVVVLSMPAPGVHADSVPRRLRPPLTGVAREPAGRTAVPDRSPPVQVGTRTPDRRDYPGPTCERG